MTRRPYPTVGQLVEAASMLHPELRRYRHCPPVARAVRHYRQMWAEHDGSYEGGQQAKAAEWALNDAVEVEHVLATLGPTWRRLPPTEARDA